MVDRTPIRLAAPFCPGNDDVAARAREAVTFLHDQRSEADWNALAKRNAAIATTLGPIGVNTTLDLMEHAYTSMMVGLYVLHDIGKLTPFPRELYARVAQ